MSSYSYSFRIMAFPEGDTHHKIGFSVDAQGSVAPIYERRSSPTPDDPETSGWTAHIPGTPGQRIAAGVATAAIIFTLSRLSAGNNPELAPEANATPATTDTNTTILVDTPPLAAKIKDIQARSATKTAEDEAVTRERVDAFKAGLRPSAMDITPVPPSAPPSQQEQISPALDGFTPR